MGKGAPDRGGIPTFLQMLSSGELARCHDVRLLNVAHTGTPEGGRLTIGNMKRTLRDVRAVWQAAEGADVVHIHSALAPTVTVLRAALLALAARGRRAAVVMHAHGGNIESWLTTPARRLLMQLAMLPAHRVVAVWTAGERALRRVLPGSRIQLIDNGVPLVDPVSTEPAVGARAPGPPRILYVGLLTPRKGVLDLAAASRILRERGIDHELCLLGGTPDEGPEAEAAVREHLPEWTRLLGTREPSEMPAAYAQADVFCLPSWWEAMPLSVLEAMASSLPVVATDVGDVSRAVQHGRTGLVVPPRDPDRLADALARLLGDAAERRRMGARGRARAEELFSADVTSREMSRLYAELTGGGR